MSAAAPAIVKAVPAKSKLVGTSTITISAVYKNGVPMLNDEQFSADVFERAGSAGSRCTVLAFVVPERLAPELKTLLLRKDGVALLIEGITPPSERDE